MEIFGSCDKELTKRFNDFILDRYNQSGLSRSQARGGDLTDIGDAGQQFHFVGGDVLNVSVAREKAIREIAALVNQKMTKLSINPASAKFSEVVSALGKALPGSGKSIKPGSNAVACKELVGILNRVLNANIPTELPMEEQCQRALTYTHLLLLGFGADVYNVYMELRRSFEDLQVLQTLASAALQNVKEKAELSSDKDFKNQTGASIQLLERLVNHTTETLRQMQSSLALGLDKDYKTVLEVIEKSKNNKEILQKLGLTDNKAALSKALSSAFSNITNTAIMTNQVSLALKRLHISSQQFRDSTNMREFISTVSKVLETVKPEEQAEFFKALNVIQTYFPNRQALGNALVKEGRGEGEEDNVSISSVSSETVEHSGYGESDNSNSDNSNSDGSESQSTGSGFFGGAAKYSQRAKDAKIVRANIIKIFNLAIQEKFDELLKNNKHIVSEFRQEKIKVDDNVNELFTSLTQLKDAITDDANIILQLIGVETRADAREKKLRFHEALKYVREMSERVGTPALKNQAKLISDILATIDKFYDIFTKAKTNTRFIKGADEPTDASDNSLEILSQPGTISCQDKAAQGGFQGGDDADVDQYKVAIKNAKHLLSDLTSFERAIDEIRYYITIYRIHENLKFSANTIKDNSEDYVKVLGKRVGEKLISLQTEKKKLIDEWLAVSKDYDYTGAGSRLTNEDNFLGTDGAQLTTGAGIPLDEQKKLLTVMCNARVSQITRFYDTKIKFYQTMEAIEMYLTAFNDGIISNPQDVQTIETMLKDGEISFDWYDKQAGNALSQVLEIGRTSVNLADATLKPLFEKISEFNAQSTQWNLGVGAAAANNVENPFTSSMEIVTSGTSKSYKIHYDHSSQIPQMMKNVFERLDVLKNLISTFIMIGKKFGGKLVESSSHIPFGQVYRNLVDFLSYSIITPIRVIGTNSTFDFGLNNPDVKSHLNATNVGIFKYTRVTADPHDLGFWEEELPFFTDVINAMCTKVFTVMGTYEMMNRPYLSDSFADQLVSDRRYDMNTRLILGGTSTISTPVIISECVELYVRLPLLLEFYRKLLKFDNNTGSAEKQIALIPEFDNVWKSLFEYFFIKYPDSNGTYGDYEAKELIGIINELYRLYKSKSPSNTNSTIVNELVSEINSRFGVVLKADSEAFRKDLYEYYYSTSAKDTSIEERLPNYKILPDEDNEFSGQAPSSQYSIFKQDIPGITPSGEVKEHIKIGESKSLINGFIDKLNNELMSESAYKTAINNGTTLTKRFKQVKHDLSTVADAEERYKSIFALMRSDGQLSDLHIIVLSLFHETITTSLTTVLAIKNIIKNHIIDPFNGSGTDILVLDNDKAVLCAAFFSHIQSLNVSLDNVITFEIMKEFMRVDCSKLIALVQEEVGLLRSLISKFNNIVDKKILDGYRMVITHLEDELIEKYIMQKPRDNTSADPFKGINECSKRMNTIWMFLLKDGAGAYDQAGMNIVLGHFVDKININDRLTVDAASLIIGEIGKLLPYVPTVQTIFNGINAAFNLKGRLFTDNLLVDFNSLLLSYVHEFYDPVQGKIYDILLSDLVTGTFSDAIYNGNNIPNINDVNRQLFPDKEHKILYHSTAAILGRLILTEVKDKPIKTFTVSTLAEVSVFMREKYKSNLPIFINLMKEMIRKIDLQHDILSCLDDSTSAPSIYDGIAAANYLSALLPTMSGSDAKLKNIYITSNEITATPGAGNPISVAFVKGFLTNVKVALHSTIKCAHKVLAEVGDKYQYFETYDGMLGDFKSANGKDSMGLYSYLTLVLSGNDNEDEILKQFRPSNNIGTDNLYKYKYAVHGIFSNYKNTDLASFPYMKNMINHYNEYYKVNQKIDASIVSKLFSVNTDLLRFVKDYRFGKIDTLVASNTILGNITAEIDNTVPVPPNPTAPLRPKIPYFVKVPATNVINEIIDMAESKYQRNNLKKVSLTIQTETLGTTDRNELRKINIFDLNISPINPHVLRREIPFVTTFLYSKVFEKITQKTLHSEFSERVAANFHTAANADALKYATESTILHALINNPFTAQVNNDLLIHQVRNIIFGIGDLPMSRPKFLDEELWKKALRAGDIDKYLESHTSKRFQNSLESSDGNKIDTKVDNKLASMSDTAAHLSESGFPALSRTLNRFNTSAIRSVFYLVNLQRILRLQMRRDIFWSIGNVVDRLPSISEDMTEITDNKRSNVNNRR